MFGIKTKIKKYLYRKKNRHNFTEIKRNIDFSHIHVGKATYGIIDVVQHSGENSDLYIGNYCSIAADCLFFLGGEHCYKYISTYPFKAKFFKIPESKTKGDIIVGDDVWIGYGSTIMSGVKIGQGAIIGAKSVVSRDIPPYAIYAGNKIIKYRFPAKVIEQLIKIDYSNLKEEIIKNKINELYTNIDEENVSDLINSIFE